MKNFTKRQTEKRAANYGLELVKELHNGQLWHTRFPGQLCVNHFNTLREVNEWFDLMDLAESAMAD